MIKQTGIHSYSYVLALYYMLAPLEDFLTGSVGTVARYLALLIVFAALMESHGIVHYRSSTVNRCILWLMLFSVLSVLWAADRSIAIGRDVAYLLVPGITLFVGLLPFGEKDYKIIINSAILGGAITILFLLATGRFNLSGYYRLTLTEHNDPNNFAALLMLPFALCFRREEGERKLVFLIKTGLAIAILVVILYTGSRGGLVSIAMAALVYLIWNKAYKKIGYIFAGVVLFFVFTIYVLPRLSSDLLSHLSIQRAMYDMEVNEGQRGAIWRHVIFDIIPDMAPWGLGAGCAPVGMASVYGYLKGVHNTYLNMMLEFGLFGIPVFLGMLFSLLIKEYRKKRFLEAALLIGICGIIFFLDSYAKKFFWNVIMLLLVGDASAKSVSSGTLDYETRERLK